MSTLSQLLLLRHACTVLRLLLNWCLRSGVTESIVSLVGDVTSLTASLVGDVGRVGKELWL